MWRWVYGCSGSALGTVPKPRHWQRCIGLAWQNWRNAMRASCPAGSSNVWPWREPGRMEPQVLLLDEPTASLDPHAKREVEALIETFARQNTAATLIFASHNLGQVKRLASRVVYLEQGRLLADLPVQDFFGGTLLQDALPASSLICQRRNP
jgi:ABC-type cobalamin transport system ATPase subunit